MNNHKQANLVLLYLTMSSLITLSTYSACMNYKRFTDQAEAKTPSALDKLPNHILGRILSTHFNPQLTSATCKRLHCVNKLVMKKRWDYLKRQESEHIPRIISWIENCHGTDINYQHFKELYNSLAKLLGRHTMQTSITRKIHNFLRSRKDSSRLVEKPKNIDFTDPEYLLKMDQKIQKLEKNWPNIRRYIHVRRLRPVRPEDPRGDANIHQISQFLRTMEPHVKNHNLRHASDLGIIDIVDIILDAGAQVNAVDDLSETALMSAAEKGHTEIAQALIDNGADVNARNTLGDTALMLAVFGNIETVKTLWNADADIHITNNYGETALKFAIMWGNTETVQTILDANAEINRANNLDTALIFAASNNRPKITRMLLDKGSNVNATDSKSNTPLIWAARNGHPEIVQILLSANANVNATNIYGKTALCLAKRRKHDEMAQILIDAGAETNTDFMPPRMGLSRFLNCLLPSNTYTETES